MRPRLLWRMQGRLRYRKLHGRLVHVSRSVKATTANTCARDQAECTAGARGAAVARAEQAPQALASALRQILALLLVQSFVGTCKPSARICHKYDALLGLPNKLACPK